jgi:hypothetical protein
MGPRPHPYLENRGFHPDAAPSWIEVTEACPCPRCGATRGCSVSEDGQFARCLLVVSSWPIADGGWLHRVPAHCVPPLSGIREPAA